MEDQLTRLRERWESARAGAQAIVREHETKSADKPMSGEDRERLRKFLDDAEAYKEQFELKSRDAALADWERKPQTNLPRPGEARVEGIFSEPSGVTYLEDKGKNFLVSSEGEGLLGPETLQAVRTPEYKASFRKYLRSADGIHSVSDADRGVLKNFQTKALQEGLDPQGGYLVPEDMLNRLISRTMAPMRLASKVYRIPTSRDSVAMPKVNYLAENDSPPNVYDSPVRVAWTGEIPASSTASRASDPLFGLTRIPVWTAMISLLLTMDMVEDAAFPIASYVSEKFGNTIQILYDNMILNGNGASQPKGLLINPGGPVDQEPATVISGAASTLTWDGLQDLAYSLPEQYDQGATFVFNKVNTARAIAGLVDGNGRPFWGMGVQDSGFSDRALGRPLLGYDVTLSALMPNVGSNAYPIVLGNFGGYYLVERVAFTVRQLGELYAETNQILLLGRVRFGGLCAEPWRFKIQKVST